MNNARVVDENARVGAQDAIDTKVVLGFLAQVHSGDFSARMPLDWTGLAGKVADGLNDLVIANQSFEAELRRVSRVVGKQGELSQRIVAGGQPRSGRAAWSRSTA